MCVCVNELTWSFGGGSGKGRIMCFLIGVCVSMFCSWSEERQEGEGLTGFRTDRGQIVKEAPRNQVPEIMVGSDTDR